MPRLIDADALVEDLIFPTKAFEKAFKELINDAPTIDAVEVVRCKDCKHNSLKRMSGNTYCDLGIGLFQLYDFCSLGERKDNESLQ